MEAVPAFFIPGIPPEQLEAAYAQLAERCSQFMGRPVPMPPRSERVYSITFVGDGEEWTATVGKTLSGKKLARPRSRGKQVGPAKWLSDSATVAAVFPFFPYLVITDGNRSRFVNPFMAGEPTSVILFASA